MCLTSELDRETLMSAGAGLLTAAAEALTLLADRARAEPHDEGRHTTLAGPLRDCVAALSICFQRPAYAALRLTARAANQVSPLQTQLASRCPVQAAARCRQPCVGTCRCPAADSRRVGGAFCQCRKRAGSARQGQPAHLLQQRRCPACSAVSCGGRVRSAGSSEHTACSIRHLGAVPQPAAPLQLLGICANIEQTASRHVGLLEGYP